MGPPAGRAAGLLTPPRQTAGAPPPESDSPASLPCSLSPEATALRAAKAERAANKKLVARLILAEALLQALPFRMNDRRRWELFCAEMNASTPCAAWRSQHSGQRRLLSFT